MMKKDSIDAIKDIIANNNSIKEIQFVEFENYKLIQNRIEISEELEFTFKSALKLREEYNLPFWDGFNLNLFNREFDNFDFFKDILFQNKVKKIINLSRYAIENFENLKTDTYTAFISTVIFEDGTKHLPLFDFHIPVSEKNLLISKNVIMHLGLKGYLLDSGKSYHFIGSTPLNELDYKNLLYKALLFTPIIDRAWVSHQLIQGFSCLRISKKYDRIPIIVSEIK
jgi:hypothetical protein